MEACAGTQGCCDAMRGEEVSGPGATPATTKQVATRALVASLVHAGTGWRVCFHAAAHASILACLLFAGNAFACKPAPWGTGSYPVTSTNIGSPHPDGEWAYWFCQTPYKTTWQMRLRKNSQPIVIPSLKDKTPIQAFEAIEAENITLSIDDPSLASLKAAAFSHLDGHIPPDPMWSVAKNGTTLTRPAYVRNADGTLGAVDKTLRADVGAQCQCAEAASRVVSGTSTYCTFKVDQPARVTLCKAVPLP